jgi:hypothetical protein
MKRQIAIACLLASSFCTGVRAQDHGIGIGIIVGEPTGLSAKAWTGGITAFDFAAAWSFSHGSALHLHGDFLLHRFDLIQVDPGTLPLYYGIGARLKFRDESGGDNEDARFGMRIPVGLAYLFDDAPLDVFVEVVPLLDLAPDTEFTLNASIGIRYFFE